MRRHSIRSSVSPRARTAQLTFPPHRRHTSQPIGSSKLVEVRTRPRWTHLATNRTSLLFHATTPRIIPTRITTVPSAFSWLPICRDWYGAWNTPDHPLCSQNLIYAVCPPPKAISSLVFVFLPKQGLGHPAPRPPPACLKLKAQYRPFAFAVKSNTSHGQTYGDLQIK